MTPARFMAPRPARCRTRREMDAGLLRRSASHAGSADEGTGYRRCRALSSVLLFFCFVTAQKLVNGAYLVGVSMRLRSATGTVSIS